MTEEKEFVRWLLLVFFLIFGVGKGIPAALILAIPEPLPKLAPMTELAIFDQWTYPGKYKQEDMLSTLDRDARLIQSDAELTMFGFPPGTKCGRMQWP